MHLSSEQTALLLQKVLDGTATVEEQTQLSAIMGYEDFVPDPERLLPYTSWLDTDAPHLPAGMKDRVLERILLREAPVGGPDTSRAPSMVRRIRLRWWLAAAAAVLVLLAGSWFFRQHTTAEIAWVRIAAGNAEPRSLQLPDGSQVQLNAGSVLQYPVTFDNNGRRVVLRGEAFFHVTRDAARPFSVLANGVRTTVLGTSFNVKAFDSDSAVAVTVSTGKVKVEVDTRAGQPGQQAVLTPGQQAVYTPNAHVMIVRMADTLAATAWKLGRLAFEDASLAAIFTVLGEKYRVRFVAADPAILSCRFTVRFDHLTLGEALSKLQLFGNITFGRKGDTIQVHGRSCD